MREHDVTRLARLLLLGGCAVAGCGKVLGADDLEYTVGPNVLGASGTGGTMVTNAGQGGDAGTSVSSAGQTAGPGGGAAGAPGECDEPVLGACCDTPQLACQGNAQKVSLSCDGSSWVLNETCGGDQNCDTTTGTCADIDARCVDHEPNESFCIDDSYVTCGPDLVSATEMLCTGQCKPDGCHSVCGNDVLEDDELCDDANDVGGDGCSPTCRFEAVKVELGSDYGCALLSNGEAKCWGDGGNGRMGNGSDQYNLSPSKVLLSRAAQDFSVGLFHGCALLFGGTVECWGYGPDGELGDGEGIDQWTPVPVDLGGVRARYVLAARYHSCIVTTYGAVRCWGDNDKGQLGTGDIQPHFTPTGDISGLDDEVLSLAGGDYFTCALLRNGNVQCWGSNTYGQLGNDNAPTASNSPVDVLLAKPARTLVAGRRHACVGHADDTVSCWGSNENSQLGYVGLIQSDVPVTADATGSATTLAAGYRHNCIVLNDEVWCWGGNFYGSLGIESTVPSTTAVKPLLGGTARNIYSGIMSDFSCALMTDGQVLCWGYNEGGNLGTNDMITLGDDPGEMADLVPVPL